MHSNSKHTLDELIEYIRLYLEEGKSYTDLKENDGLLISYSTFNQKVLRYQENGLAGIQTKSSNNQYSAIFKESVAQEYFDTDIPIRQLARKYNISSDSTLRNWIIRYTKGEKIRSYSPKPEVYTMKSAKKTQSEKIEIVKDFLETGLSYKDSAEKHHVSYNNVYSWVQKYKQHGPDGLIDGRGRRKPSTVQTDEEKLQTENAALKARNDYLEAENAALKKLDEVERELMLRKQGMMPSTKRLKNYKKKDTK